MTGVLDDYMVDPKVSLLDKARIQAQVLVPLLRTLRAEIGKEKADAIARKALSAWSRQIFDEIGAGMEGSPRRKWSAMQGAMNAISEPDVEFKMLHKDKESLAFDVTRCRFAEFFRDLDEPDLGALLVCSTDIDIAASGEGEVSFERTQTIMQGAPSCTFRYRFAPR